LAQKLSMSEDTVVSILCRLYSDILEDEHSESVKAEVVNEEYGYYKLLNIPFYLPKIAIGDIVWAEFKAIEGKLTYRKTIEYSGNSTVHVVVTDDEYTITDICQEFELLGCKSRVLNNKYLGLIIPVEVDYYPAKQLLELLEKNKVIGYAESSLSQKHQYKNFYL